jgi:hypothetical protein
MNSDGTERHIVCMLAERSYFHGAAALANSLVRNGFSGHIVVGYRGSLPHWDGPVSPAPGPAQRLAPGADICFVEVTGDWHLSNQKPHFMLRILAELYPQPASIWYFDVDIVLKTAWSSFVRWAEGGMVLVLDMAETYMPVEHVFRREWRALGERAGLGHRPVSGYFNGGCVGLPGQEVGFLRAWACLLDEYAREGADMARMVDRSGKPEFAKMDQDLMNAAVMATQTPYGVLGVEAMDAFPSAQIMSHAMVFDKPWIRNYIRDAIIGYQPDPAHLAYWSYADGPIRSFTAAEWRRKKIILKITRLLGYIKRRTVRDW